MRIATTRISKMVRTLNKRSNIHSGFVISTSVQLSGRRGEKFACSRENLKARQCQPRVRPIATQLLVPADQVRVYCHSTMERISRPAGCRIELLAATAPDAAWLAWTSIILGIDLDPERETVIEHPRCDPVVDLPDIH